VIYRAGNSPLISPTDTSRRTLADYDATAAEFRDGTRDHDVTENVAAFVDAIEGPPPWTILDFGWGPGRCDRPAQEQPIKRTAPEPAD